MGQGSKNSLDLSEFLSRRSLGYIRIFNLRPVDSKGSGNVVKAVREGYLEVFSIFQKIWEIIYLSIM